MNIPQAFCPVSCVLAHTKDIPNATKSSGQTVTEAPPMTKTTGILAVK